MRIPSCHRPLSHGKEDTEKWFRWIGVGALMLALASLLAPVTTSAAIKEQKEEVIVIEDEAPLTSPWWNGGYTGSSGSPSGPSDGGGGASGGGSVPSSGSTGGSAKQKRLAAAKQDCLVLGGVWKSAVFNDIVTNIRYSGYSCRLKYPNGQYEWSYFDSEGNYNHRCVGDLDVSTCE